MKIDELKELTKTITDSGLEPLDYINQEIKKLEERVGVLQKLKSVFDPSVSAIPAKRTWSRTKKEEPVGTVTLPPANQPAADSDLPKVNKIAIELALFVSKGSPGRTMGEIIRANIASDPTCRSYVKSPDYKQQPSGHWTLTDSGRIRLLGK